jgi:hypothetical protein
MIVCDLYTLAGIIWCQIWIFKTIFSGGFITKTHVQKYIITGGSCKQPAFNAFTQAVHSRRPPV